MVAVGNSGDPEFIPALKESLSDEEPLVRAHAVWALHKIQGEEALSTLREHKKGETDKMVIDEIELILRSTV